VKKVNENETYSETINIKVSPTLKSKLAKVASKQGHNISSLARLWLSERVKEEKVK
jgi:hypothetical protein